MEKSSGEVSGTTHYIFLDITWVHVPPISLLTFWMNISFTILIKIDRILNNWSTPWFNVDGSTEQSKPFGRDSEFNFINCK
jgi:hypothetical protein